MLKPQTLDTKRKRSDEGRFSYTHIYLLQQYYSLGLEYYVITMNTVAVFLYTMEKNIF